MLAGVKLTCVSWHVSYWHVHGRNGRVRGSSVCVSSFLHGIPGYTSTWNTHHLHGGTSSLVRCYISPGAITFLGWVSVWFSMKWFVFCLSHPRADRVGVCCRVVDFMKFSGIRLSSAAHPSVSFFFLHLSPAARQGDGVELRLEDSQILPSSPPSQVDYKKIWSKDFEDDSLVVMGGGTLGGEHIFKTQLQKRQADRN